MDQTRLTRIARRQAGLFSRKQARTCGFNAAHVARRQHAGIWLALDARVLMLPATVVTPGVRDVAAHLSVPGSVLAGLSAARRWQIDVPDREPQVIVERRVRPIPGIRIERAALSARERTRVDGIPTTTRDRTVFDCLRLLPVDNAASLLDRALREGWVTLPELADRAQLATGRHGIDQARRLLRAAADGSRSAAERQATRLLRQAGIAGWTANAPIRDGRGLIGIADIVFRAARVVVEVDGWAFHSSAEAFQRDRARQNRLVAAGWTVLRFTWWDLTKRPAVVVQTILAALDRA